ncbi:hypothetical protein [Streptomyces scabiei]|uniref:hypothetical protein n=1 Tax=Streptomyces scabiei TaxID=1930 RepID=UPI0029B883F0|nr:hypothetical protein [Streptomyces scabiei]MDX2572499.1 hypothetical protein [Streptomyces scabiei]
MSREKQFICSPHHDLAQVDKEACARLMPQSTQEQMAFLLMKYQGNSGAVAAMLHVSRRTVERHAKGKNLLPPRKDLRARLREWTLGALCPVRLEAAAAEEARRARRGRRRAREDD